MVRDQPTSLRGFLGLAFVFLAVASVPASAQDEPASQNEIEAVFRISKRFVEDVTRRKIVADIPLRATVVNFRCTGMIHGEATASVQLETSGEKAIFSVDCQGNGQSCVTGTRGPLVAYGPVWGPFSSRTLIQFNGREFSHLSTTPHVTVHGKLQRVTGRGDRALGRIIGAGIQPLAKGLVPKAIVQATPIAGRHLHDFVTGMADEIIQKLNHRTPVEESVNRLFPKTADWVFQVSSSSTHIQAAYGPAGAPVPALPDAGGETISDPRFEAWLRSTNEEARLLADMSKNPLAKQLVRRYLESTLPELAALAGERSVDAVDDWVVIRIGEPEAD